MTKPCVASTKPQMQVGTWDWDLRSKTIRCGGVAADLLGVKADQRFCSSIVEDYYNRVHTSDRERVKKTIQMMVDVGRQYNIVYKIHDPRGRLRRVVGQGHAIRDKDGQPMVVYGMMSDVTDGPSDLFEEPTHLDVIADNLLSARAQSIHVEDKLLTYLIDVTLRHIVDEQRVDLHRMSERPGPVERSRVPEPSVSD